MRSAGNEAAHGLGLSIEQADAKDILEFTNAIMDYLFSFRDRFEEFKKLRSAITRRLRERHKRTPASMFLNF
jgi:hypothetical protein